MIHYTLLPETEIKSLKREYKTRIFIVLLFFISCGITVGIISLFPSFILSYTQEKNSLQKIESFQKNRVDNGSAEFSRELSESSIILQKLKADQDHVVFSDMLKRIIQYKNKSVALYSFQILRTSTASSSLEMVLQGKALTRESLLEFKRAIEQDASVLRVELPLSDLAKSKDISFGLRIHFKQ